MSSEKQPPPDITDSGSVDAASTSRRANGLITFAIVLGLLYLGRDILIPLALALMLSLLLVPPIRALRKLGLSQAPAVLVAVSVLAVVVLAIAMVLGTQVLRMAESLPQYQHTIQQKLQSLDELTVGRLTILTGEANSLIERRGAAASDRTPYSQPSEAANLPAGAGVQQSRAADPLRIIAAVATTLWRPIETTGIVVVVLVFVLLEHETLRDRIIRVAGQNQHPHDNHRAQ